VLLGTSPQVSFVLDAKLRVAYRNWAWNRFAIENGAPELAGAATIGIDLQNVVGRELLPFYLQRF
jgi:hypothetical protein